ncbi:MAG: chalcone isomerase family protein [Desulforhopalus sp.]
MPVFTITLLSLFLFHFASTTSAVAMNIDQMHLLGKGEVYYLKFIKVYDAALYADRQAVDDDILHSDVSKCLQLQYAVGVDREDFINAANTVLNRQFGQETLGQVAMEIETLHRGYRDVEKGDIYTLCYYGAETKTNLYLNGRQLVTIHSKDFAEIYFSIWLGESGPLDDTLRNNLLAMITDDQVSP